MSKQIENQMVEELSEIIDAINHGERIPHVSAENQELAEIAGLLRKAGPPPAVIEKLSATLAAEMNTKQKRRKVWFLSGTAGTVAASLLVLALNLSPQQPVAPQVPLPIPPAGSIVIQSIPEPAQRGGDEETPPPTGSVPKTKEIAKAPAVVADVPKQVAAEDSTKQGNEEPEAPKMATFARKAETKSETPAKRAAVFVLPGKKPDSVTGDKATGTVRIVYGMGKDEEITVTERPENQAVAPQAERQKSVATLKNVDEKSQINKVTITAGGVEITVEGKQTKEELMKIAQSLVAE